jgi:hypothetical protein
MRRITTETPLLQRGFAPDKTIHGGDFGERGTGRRNQGQGERCRGRRQTHR